VLATWTEYNPIQSNLYCKNTADKTQQNWPISSMAALDKHRENHIKKTSRTLKMRKKVMRMPVMKSVGVFVQQSNDKVFSC